MSSDRIKKKAHELGGQSIYRLMLRYSIPTTIGFFVFSIYNIVDRMFIGRYGGPHALAGVSITFPIFMIAIAIGMLIGVGGGTLTSIRLGEKKFHQAEEILGNVIAVFVMSGIIITILGEFFLVDLLRFFGASDTILPYACQYLRILMAVIVFDFLAMGTNGMVQAEGNPLISMTILSVGAILNVILDYIFIARMGMGVQGAALATAISKLISSVWIIWHFTKGPRRVLTLHLKNIRIRIALTKSILFIGLSPFSLMFINSFFITITNRYLIRYGGDIAVGAMGIIHSIIMLLLMPIIGINRGGQPIIGFNYGARNFARVKQALKISLGASLIIGLAGTVLVQLLAPTFAGLFTSDPALTKTAASGMRLMLLLLPLGAFQTISSNYFQSTGRPIYSISLHLLRMIVFYFPLIVIFSSRWGLNGIWLTTPACDILAGITSAVIIARESKRLNRDSLLN